MSLKVRSTEFEIFHSARVLLTQTRPAMREFLITFAITLGTALFSFVTFFVIPIMGQITVGLSLICALLYLYFRRSLLGALTVGVGAALFWSLLFLGIQGIKSNLEVPLFFFAATAIPVCVAYCIFIGTQIRTIRGGIDPL